MIPGLTHHPVNAKLPQAGTTCYVITTKSLNRSVAARATVPTAERQPSPEDLSASITLTAMPISPLRHHQDRLESWAEEILRPYLKRLQLRKPPYGSSKELNDAVWGTTQLRPDEVLILDSPLLQRLRRIRQLGVVHLVYPAATHTRLEHSLGVVHQVQQLVTNINGHGLRENHGAPLTLEHERTLRLAALCHDIGHGAFSHVSEHAVESRDASVEITMAFSKNRHREVNQLSEIAAYFILGSPAFNDLLEQVQRLANPVYVEDLAEKLQNIIVGEIADSRILLLHELISGPFDADKLDYLTRDAMMCGVPVVADVPRLVQKARAIEISASGLPMSLQRLAPGGQNVILTGIARSGARTLDEVALARTLLFDKIYRHHKVRASEAMISSLIDQLLKVVPVEPAMLPFMLCDDELISLSESRIAELVGEPVSQLEPSARAAAEVAIYLGKRICDRRIFARGFAFAAVMPRDGYRLEERHSSGLKRFLQDCADHDRRMDLVTELSTSLNQICELISRLDLITVPGGDLTPYLWISGPKAPPKTASSETGHAYLIDESGSVLQAVEDTAETPAWNDAYVTTRDLGYVFCLRRHAPHVYLAMEQLVRTKYDIHMPDTMLAYAKQDPKEIAKLRKALDDAGWYRDKPQDLRPMPRALTTEAAGARADEVVRKLQGYAGPYLAGAAQHRPPASTMSRQLVLSFARQFEEDDLIDAALTAVSNIKVLGRGEANVALNEFMASHPEFAGASYCTLGESKDSSSLLTYYVGDSATAHDMVGASNLSEALSTERPIVFVDDLVGRGSQSISIIEDWLGVEPTQQLNERRNSRLSDEAVAKLKDRNLAFVFIAGFTRGEEILKARLLELGLKATVFVQIPQSHLPFVQDFIPDVETYNRFKSFCCERATELLLDPENGRDESWVADRVFGYGNSGLLLASTYNTPSATVTCFWKEDKKRSDWEALIRRRPKR